MSSYRASNKAYYEKNKDKWKDYAKKYKSTREGQLKAQYFVARRRAELRGIEFTIEIDDLLSCPDICPVLGIEIKYGEGRNSWYSPSIDRFDPSKGYVKGNIRMISNRANTLKSNGTVEEFEKIISYMKEKS